MAVLGVWRMPRRGACLSSVAPPKKKIDRRARETISKLGGFCRRLLAGLPANGRWHISWMNLATTKALFADDTARERLICRNDEA